MHHATTLERLACYQHFLCERITILGAVKKNAQIQSLVVCR